MTRRLHGCLFGITLGLILTLSEFGMTLNAKEVETDQGAMHELGAGHDGHVSGSQWEGSPEGKAYSEFNHHVAGGLVVLIGLAELAGALGWSRMAWARSLLPVAMIGGGLLLLIWSDHEAWPIGHMSFSQTYLGRDHEIVQHKIYAILSLSLGTIEWLRRSGALRHVAWRMLLPAFALVGGLMLFMHSHGAHPSAHKIALHHAAMGALALLAGSCKLASVQGTVMPGEIRVSRWELAWSGLVLAIGIQLLFYSE
ncbi:MAG: hypothetical protein HZB35_05835 [Nitrospirae bacterium]|nr:hypothetical protein [Nitrospirota bacterium]